MINWCEKLAKTVAYISGPPFIRVCRYLVRNCWSQWL